MPAQEMEITAALARLKAVDKFRAEAFYPGAPNESLRVEAELSVNTLLERLMPVLRAPADKTFVLQEFRLTLDSFTQSDTEERERLCGYLEEIMDIAGIESSDGLLNGWLYGFDPSGTDAAPALDDEPVIAQVWSDLDMQVYAYIEGQLAGAESRRDTLLRLSRGLQVINLSDYVGLIAPALRELPCEPAALIFEQAVAERKADHNPLVELDQQFRSESRNFPELRSKLLEKYEIRL
jgi:hypothetical protein